MKNSTKKAIEEYKAACRSYIGAKEGSRAMWSCLNKMDRLYERLIKAGINPLSL